MEILSAGTKLMVAETKTGTFKELYGLKGTPEMGGDREKKEITNLNDKNKRYIYGLNDFGDMEFSFFYNDDDENSNVSANAIADAYAQLRAYDKQNKAVWFKLVYPDGTGHLWQGAVSVKREAASVNDPLSFKLKTTAMTEIEDTTGEAAG